MRTTLTIDDDVLAVARALASRRGVSLGSAVSDLARRGFRGTGVADQEDDGVPVFPVPSDAPPITSEDVQRALDEWHRSGEPADLSEHDFDDRLLRLVRRALDGERISLGRAAEILGLTRDEMRQQVRQWAGERTC